MLASTDSEYQKTLEQERLAIRRALPFASEETLQQVFSDREAQLQNEFGSTTQLDGLRSCNVPRSLSFGGPIDSRSNPGGNLTRALDRDENKSTRSAPADMIDSDTRSSYSSPINSTNFVSDPFGNAMNMEWDENYSTYTLSPETGFGQAHYTSESGTPGVRVYDDPNDFVSALSPHFDSRIAQSTSPFADLPKLDSANLTLYRLQSVYDSPSDSHSGPNTPKSEELTPCSTQISNMSREGSALGASLKNVPFDMLRLDSSMPVSVHSDVFSREDPLLFPCHVKPENFNSHFPSVYPDSDALLSSTLSASYGANAPYSQSISLSSLEGEMKRSTSFQSTHSGSSAQSRSSQRKQEILASSNRPIAPKGASDNENSMSRTSSQHKMVRVVSQDGSSKDVAQISKAPYIRPSHPKIICPHCAEYPEGFRGEHELRRHVDRKHAKVKKVWVTTDSSPGKTFLANCKQCRNQKQYGAYYNAAAHLRRAHFHPRKRGRKGKHDSEKRGGKGGGDDPPMDYLKQHWMKEIEVIVSDSDLASSTCAKEAIEASRPDASSSRGIPYNFTEAHAMGGDVNVTMSQLSQPQLPLPQVPPTTPSQALTSSQQHQQLQSQIIEPAAYSHFDTTQMSEFAFDYQFANAAAYPSSFDFNADVAFDSYDFNQSQQ